MLTESRKVFLVELRGWDGGLSLLQAPPTLPREHAFQGGLIYSSMIEIAGVVQTPSALQGRELRIWLTQITPSHFRDDGPPYIGSLRDRTGELPGGGLETMLYIPKDTWATAVQCLATIWRQLELTGVDGDGREMTVVDFSFSAGGPS